MKKTLTILLSLTVLTSCVATPALAVPSSEVVKANCRAVQSVLNQMEKADAALRINQGRVYNELLNLFYAMNTRLLSNKISLPNLVSLTSEFESVLGEFRANYNSYDDALGDLVGAKCQEEPMAFYDKLVKVRDERAKLNSNIKRLDQLVELYGDEFNTNAKAQINAR